jgi:hypothetical protein
VTAGLLLALTGGAAEFPQGLMLHFSFDEKPVRDLVPDRTGRDHDGRATGATWTVSGKQGGGLAFAASNACLTVSNAPALRLKQATCATWFQTPAATAAGRTIFDKPQEPRCVLDIAGEAPEAKEKGRLRARFGNQVCLSDSNVTDGAWRHVAATFDGTTLKLYIDGRPQMPAAARPVDAPPTAAGGWVIGLNKTGFAAGEAGRPFVGTLDDIMVFNHVLTEVEVGAVMAAAKPKFTQEQVARRLAELKELLDRGLILQDFYDRKVKECETGQ